MGRRVFWGQDIELRAMIRFMDMASTVQLEELYRPVQGPLDEVCRRLELVWRDFLRLMNGESEANARIGGKLLRPALCLLSAGASGAPDLSRFVPMATAMETFHLGALAHDDVIDGAFMRRGVSSINARWNDHVAVLGGDYLIARGLRFLASYSCPPAVANVVDCLCRMAEGELSDLANGKTRSTLDQCVQLAQAKTASFFGMVCSTPAYLVKPAFCDVLRRFGVAVGTAFQLMDDVLDLTQPEETLGKPPCNDLARHKNTLPILFLRQGLGKTDAARLDSLTGGSLSRADQIWVAELVARTGARERTEDFARAYISTALQSLDELPQTAYVDSMRGVAEFVLLRAS